MHTARNERGHQECESKFGEHLNRWNPAVHCDDVLEPNRAGFIRCRCSSDSFVRGTVVNCTSTIKQVKISEEDSANGSLRHLSGCCPLE